MRQISTAMLALSLACLWQTSAEAQNTEFTIGDPARPGNVRSRNGELTNFLTIHPVRGVNGFGNSTGREGPRGLLTVCFETPQENAPVNFYIARLDERIDSIRQFDNLVDAYNNHRRNFDVFQFVIETRGGRRAACQYFTLGAGYYYSQSDYPDPAAVRIEWMFELQ